MFALVHIIFAQRAEEGLGVVLEEIGQPLHRLRIVVVVGVFTAVGQDIVHQPDGLVGVVAALQVSHTQIGPYLADGVGGLYHVDGLLVVVVRHLVVAPVFVDGAHRAVYHVEVVVAVLLHFLQHLLGHLQRLAAAPHVDFVGHLVDAEHVVALPAAALLHDGFHLLVQDVELLLFIGLAKQLVVALHHPLLLVGISGLGVQRGAEQQGDD